MNKSVSLKAVIFDLGETLITYTTDYTEREKKISEKVQNLFSKMGYSIPEKLYHELKREMWKNWKEQFRLSETEFEIGDFLYHLLRKLGVKAQDAVKFIPLITEIIYKYDLKYVVLKPAVKDTLKKLQNMSYLMGIISNTSYSYDHILEILKRHEIIDYFNAVIVSSKERVCKPNPKIFKKALQLLGISANEAVFVGNDLQVDIKGAERAGIKSILITDAEQGIDKIRQSNTNMKVVRNIREILKYLKK
jgi:putative hydrolase of the HAD superfamily